MVGWEFKMKNKYLRILTMFFQEEIENVEWRNQLDNGIEEKLKLKNLFFFNLHQIIKVTYRKY